MAGQTAALALKKVKRNQVRKGMVLVDERAKPKASWEFDADIAILTHSTTIQPRYQVGHATAKCILHHQDSARVASLLFLDSLRALIPVLAVVWHSSGWQVNLSALKPGADCAGCDTL